MVSRSVCDYFFEAQERATELENVPPVISTPHHYLISVLRHRIYFVAVIQSEVPPLFVIEFLHRVVDTFQVGPFCVYFTFSAFTLTHLAQNICVLHVLFCSRTILAFAQRQPSRITWWWSMSCWRRCWTMGFHWPQSPTSSKSSLSLPPFSVLWSTPSQVLYSRPLR